MQRSETPLEEAGFLIVLLVRNKVLVKRNRKFIEFFAFNLLEGHAVMNIGDSRPMQIAGLMEPMKVGERDCEVRPDFIRMLLGDLLKEPLRLEILEEVCKKFSNQAHETGLVYRPRLEPVFEPLADLALMYLERTGQIVLRTSGVLGTFSSSVRDGQSSLKADVSLTINGKLHHAIVNGVYPFPTIDASVRQALNSYTDGVKLLDDYLLRQEIISPRGDFKSRVYVVMQYGQEFWTTAACDAHEYQAFFKALVQGYCFAVWLKNKRPNESF